MRTYKILISLFSIVFLFNVKSYAQQVMDIHDPDIGNVKYIGHPFVVQPRIYLNGQDIDTLAMRLMHFTPARNTISNVNVHNLFSSQVILDNTTDNSTGTQRIDIGKVALTPDYTNTSFTPFADITLLAVDTGVGANGVCTSENGWLDCTSTFTLDYDGGPLQSGAFLGGVNHLASVDSLTVSLQEDSTKPIWSDCNLVSGATNVPVNSNISCKFRDYETGIYLGSTTINIYDNYGFNNITYTNSGADQYSATAISDGYNINVNPVQNFPYASIITVFGSGQDNAYNNGPVLDRNTGTFVTSGLADPYTFTTEDDIDAPEIYNIMPGNGETGVSMSNNINFNIHDVHSLGGYPGLGVDINTLSVTVSAPGWGSEVYTISSPELTANILGTNTPYGNPYDYSISINPTKDFPQNVDVNVQITIGDFHSPSNMLNMSYSFSTADTESPFCYGFFPERGATDVQINNLIKFRCADTGVGVNIDSINVIVDNIVYSRSGDHTFSYTGDSSEYEITIDPDYLWDVNYAFEVVINASDFSNNAMSQISYGLATGTSEIICPICEECQECEECPYSNIQQCEDDEIESVIENKQDNVSQDNIIINQKNYRFLLTQKDVEAIELKAFNGKATMEGFEISSEDDINLVGRALPGSYVMLMFESKPLILITMADENGNWNMRFKNIFTPGKHNVYVISRDEFSKDIVAKKHLVSFNVVDTPNKVSVSDILSTSNTKTLFTLYILYALGSIIIVGSSIFIYTKFIRNRNANSK